VLSYSADAARGVARLLAAASALGVLLVCAGPAAADEPSSPGDAVVGRGQESLLAEMLGRGEALPGACAFAGGTADGATVRATYRCADADVVIELRPPTQNGAAGGRTARFAIAVVSGAPPPGLLGALQARIAAREAELTWTSPPRDAEQPMRWIAVGELFFVVLIAAVGLALWRSRTSLRWREAALPAGLAMLALIMRFIAHPGPADIRAVLDERFGTARAGWVAFVRLVYDVLPRRDETIWTIDRLLGALAVPLLYLVMRKRFADPTAAVGGAAVLAVTPLLARFSASDTPYIPLCAALLGAVVAYDSFVESASVAALALALGLLTAAIQLRPDAAWLIVPVALLALGRPPRSWTQLLRPSVGVCVILFVLLNAVPTMWALSAPAKAGAGQSFVVVGSLIGSPWTVRDITPLTLSALVVLGAVSAPLYGRSGLLWLAAVVLAEPLDMPTSVTYANAVYGHFANARYHVPAMYLACGLAGLGVAALIRLSGWFARREIPARNLIAVGIAFLAAAPRFDLLRRMWTPQREYEIFRAGLSGIEPNCHVVTFTEVGDAGFVPFEYLAGGKLLDVGEFLSAPREGCFIYYRAGNCYEASLAPELARQPLAMNPACRAIEERFRLEPIVEARVPALPYRGEVYVRDTLPLGFFRLRPATPDGAGARQ
jgi:hypothetical protein